MKILLATLSLFAVYGCNAQIEETNSATETSEVLDSNVVESEKPIPVFPYDSTIKTIHVYVALCDNVHQGIVPVPSKIGNGQDPHNNLYWGCGFGVRTFFKRSKEWQLLKLEKLDSIRLERIVFKHTTKNFYLVADAYDGRSIFGCTRDFLRGSAGIDKDTIHINGTVIGLAGNAKMLAYIGHDGLMDFQMTENFENLDNQTRDVIVLACYSREYFTQHLKPAKVRPLVWTTGLMAPEAYTLHDAITGYVNGESEENIRSRAASAYSKYQKCSERAARALLVSGWK